MKVIALATCHNRRDLTLRALESLHRQVLPADCEMTVCLVDDGSSDGTAAEVRSRYPRVEIIEGDGSLFWAGGMRLGWDSHVRHQQFDYLLVFNDDVDLYQDALQNLLSVASLLEHQDCRAFAIAGAFKKPDTGELAYGGVVRKNWWHPLRFKKIPPGGEPRECATVNMNATLISRAALDLVGFLSPEFIHKTADYDFGLRLRKEGGRIMLAPDYVGECATNPVSGTVNEPGTGLGERWQRLLSLKGQPPRLRALYFRRHGGPFWAFFWILSYIRIFVIGSLDSVRLMIFGKKRL